MPPFPYIYRIGLAFQTDLSPTDLNINRGHLIIKDYLLTKFEAFGAKHSGGISCTRWSRLEWPLTLTLTFWLEYQYGSSFHHGLSTYQVWSFLGKAFLDYQLHKVKAILQVWIYKALYDFLFLFLGSKNNYDFRWIDMLDFICNGSVDLFGTGRERKIQNENICLQRDSNPHNASPRQESHSALNHSATRAWWWSVV